VVTPIALPSLFPFPFARPQRFGGLLVQMMPFFLLLLLSVTALGSSLRIVGAFYAFNEVRNPWVPLRTTACSPLVLPA